MKMDSEWSNLSLDLGDLSLVFRAATEIIEPLGNNL